MNQLNKGRLVESLVKCSDDLDVAKRLLSELESKYVELEKAITEDKELSDLLANGGVSTIDNRLLQINRRGVLYISKVIASYNIESDLTSKQAKVIGVEECA